MFLVNLVGGHLSRGSEVDPLNVHPCSWGSYSAKLHLALNVIILLSEMKIRELPAIAYTGPGRSRACLSVLGRVIKWV